MEITYITRKAKNWQFLCPKAKLPQNLSKMLIFQAFGQKLMSEVTIFSSAFPPLWQFLPSTEMDTKNQETEGISVLGIQYIY